MRDFLERLLGGRYLAMLEAEVARLRAENRALMNSLLGTAGFPPVEFPEASKPQPLPRLRKRSWHQLRPGARMKQIAPARIMSKSSEQPGSRGWGRIVSARYRVWRSIDGQPQLVRACFDEAAVFQCRCILT